MSLIKPEYQQFRSRGSLIRVKVTESLSTGLKYVFWGDLRLAFPGIVRVQDDDALVPLMRCQREYRLRPFRIEYMPGAVLDVFYKDQINATVSPGTIKPTSKNEEKIQEQGNEEETHSLATSHSSPPLAPVPSDPSLPDHPSSSLPLSPPASSRTPENPIRQSKDMDDTAVSNMHRAEDLPVDPSGRSPDAFAPTFNTTKTHAPMSAIMPEDLTSSSMSNVAKVNTVMSLVKNLPLQVAGPASHSSLQNALSKHGTNSSDIKNILSGAKRSTKAEMLSRPGAHIVQDTALRLNIQTCGHKDKDSKDNHFETTAGTTLAPGQKSQQKGQKEDKRRGRQSVSQQCGKSSPSGAEDDSTKVVIGEALFNEIDALVVSYIKRCEAQNHG
ncbi:hypothetical protein BGZ54_001000 [Gamsiella multidivaricata]|nr:hypothetical protein BGZ54_001000 [Gamsiella multidivaricata]